MLLVRNINHGGNDMMTSMLLWFTMAGSAANKVTQYMQTMSSINSLP